MARHIRRTVETDSPLARAMSRELQWVASGALGLKGADDHRLDPGILDSAQRPRSRLVPKTFKPMLGELADKAFDAASA